ncbi:hypothetical protein MKX62_16380 [Sporosarcina sp. FSL K6-5500]
MLWILVVQRLDNLLHGAYARISTHKPKALRPIARTEDFYFVSMLIQRNGITAFHTLSGRIML